MPNLDQILNWINGNLPVAAAIITAGVSALVSIFVLFTNTFVAGRLEKLKSELNRSLELAKADTQRSIEKHKSELADSNSERTAKRDYEYEAKKRLYEQVEPLMFQLSEAAEAAQLRVESICRTSRAGDLGAEGWLSRPGYYLRSTIYRLLLPAAILRLLQRRMTFIDMRLDSSYARTYSLLKIYMGVLADDYGIAALEPALPYRPKETGIKNATHQKQGMYMGHLEGVMDLMLIKDGTVLRPCTYGEFETLVRDNIESEHFGALVALFMNFAPDTHQVLARTLHLLGLTANAVSQSSSAPSDWQANVQIDSMLASEATSHKYSWAEGDQLFAKPYKEYFRKRLIA